MSCYPTFAPPPIYALTPMPNFLAKWLTFAASSTIAMPVTDPVW